MQLPSTTLEEHVYKHELKILKILQKKYTCLWTQYLKLQKYVTLKLHALFVMQVIVNDTSYNCDDLLGDLFVECIVNYKLLIKLL